jgi:hypothetical protein
VRTLAFGGLADGLWGFVWSRQETVAIVGSLGDEPETSVVRAELVGEPEADRWTLTGEGVELRAVAGHGQLCTVAGAFGVGGIPGELETLGLRASIPADLAAVDSLRVVLAWFAPDDGLAVSSARPRGAAGHDHDEVIATVFEPGGALTIDDGRLSTTYDATGQPTRMSLELWLPDEEESYPRRAAGEVIGMLGEAELADAELEVHALECHRAGRDGLGVYALASSTGR